MSEDREGNLTRRMFARLAVWGAVGLSLTGGCRKNASLPPSTACYAPPPPPGSSGALFGNWARLGGVWRELTAHSQGATDKWDDPGARFEELRTEMDTALDDLPAWPELRVVFEERWQHVWSYRHTPATCYDPAGSLVSARFVVEEQVDVLAELVEQDTLTKEAAGKAAAVLAVQAEFMARYHEAQETAEDGNQREAVEPVVEEYDAGETVAGEEAHLAGERLAELTVDKLEWLAGPVATDDGDAEGETDG